MLSNNDQLILAFKIIMPKVIEALLTMADNDDEREMLKTIMAEMLMLAATVHRASGGSIASFVVMARESIELMQIGGATKQ